MHWIKFESSDLNLAVQSTGHALCVWADHCRVVNCPNCPHESLGWPRVSTLCKTNWTDEHLGKKQPPTPCLTNTQLNQEQLPGQGWFDLVAGGICNARNFKAELVISQLMQLGSWAKGKRQTALQLNTLWGGDVVTRSSRFDIFRGLLQHQPAPCLDSASCCCRLERCSNKHLLLCFFQAPPATRMEFWLVCIWNYTRMNPD